MSADENGKNEPNDGADAKVPAPRSGTSLTDAVAAALAAVDVAADTVEESEPIRETEIVSEDRATDQDPDAVAGESTETVSTTSSETDAVTEVPAAPTPAPALASESAVSDSAVAAPAVAAPAMVAEPPRVSQAGPPPMVGGGGAAPPAPALAAVAVGPAAVGPAAVGPAAVGPAAVGPAAVGPVGFRTGMGSFQDLMQRISRGESPATRSSAVPMPSASAVSTTSSNAETVSEEASSASLAEIAVRYFGRTDVGLVREHNEDNFMVADLTNRERGTGDAPRDVVLGPGGCIFAVCDGMGGAAAGEVASQMAVDTIHDIFMERTAEGLSTLSRDEFAALVVHSIEQAGQRIFSAAKMDRTRRGMGTTCTLAGLMDNVLFVGQVGDSRAYVLRGESLIQITKDQSLVNQLIEAGQLSEEEAEAFEHSNIILQALGTTEEVTVDITFLELRHGDRLMMCSDGLSGLVHGELMKDALFEERSQTDAAAKLIQMANAGGGHDNITVIVADFEGAGLDSSADASAVYQQYPLPSIARDSASGQRPRATSMKPGGPKPGADVKGGPFEAPAGGAGLMKWALLAVFALGLLVIGGILAVVATQTGDDTEETPVAATPSPSELPVVPTRPESPVVPTPPEPSVTPTPELPVDPPVPVQGRLRIVTDATDGELFVNGESYGLPEDGRILSLDPGDYDLEIRRDGEALVSQHVDVVSDEERTVSLPVPEVEEVPEETGPTPEELAAQEAAEAEARERRAERRRRLLENRRRQQERLRDRRQGSGSRSGGGGSNAVPDNPF